MKQQQFRRILRQAVFVPVLLLLLLAFFFIAQLRRLSTAVQHLHQVDAITTRIINLEKLILDQETGLRGYELTRNPEMLAPYRAGMAPIQQSFADLQHWLAGDKAQEQRLADLSSRYQTWLERADRSVAEGATTRNPKLDIENKKLMDGIRGAVDELLAGEQARRAESLREEPYVTHLDLLTTLLAALVIGLAVAVFTRRRLRSVSKSYDAALAEMEQHSREAHENRQWFQTTLESIGDAVIACDMEGRVRFLNAVAAALTGWNAEEAVGRPLAEVFPIIHEETRQPVENPAKKVRRLKKVVGLANHTVLISRDGKEFLIEDSAAPILTPEGEMTGIVLVFHDVTEQRRTEAALISGEKLAVAGRLAASIAHEIHNPLDSVSNLLFLLKNEEDATRRAEYLQMAQQELARTMQISRTMLSLYRESKSPVAVDLKDLIGSVLLLLERRISLEQIQLVFECDAPCVIEGFPAELRQVITNVLVNAIEAAGQHGRVRIRLKSAAAEEFRGAGAMIEVADSGPGIQDGDARRIFRPFFTTKGEKGTGLGLWVSMGIVQKYGGYIRLQNCGEEQYPGACASIYLPAKTLPGRTRRPAPVA